MQTKFTTPANKNQLSIGKLALLCLTFFSLFACQKEITNPQTVDSQNDPTNTLQNFQISETTITLLEGNANRTGLNLRWESSNQASDATYTIEACLPGSNFSDIVELGITDQTNVMLSVKDLNLQFCKLIATGSKGIIELRIKSLFGNELPVYSNPVALTVTTYQHYTAYDKTQIMHIPGNFQNWDMSDAPELISIKNDGDYEGYINFTNAYPQFLLVKEEKWDPIKTYTYIGGNKFGFGGSVFSIFGGTGIYLMKASTTSNSYSYTKINTWGIHGTAVNPKEVTDPEMLYNASTKTWNIQLDLLKGDFRISANNSQAISLGNTVIDGYLVPDAKGVNFNIKKAGYYQVTLNVNLAGNYNCNLIKIAYPNDTD